MTKEQIKEYTLRTTQANQSGLVMVLFEIENIFLDDALRCYEESDTDGFLKNLEQARKAHNELMAAMNPRDINGYRVWSLLRYMYRLLANAMVKREPIELDRVAGMMDKLREGFAAVCEKDDEPPVMKNTHQVYAGLTYGRGSLNESYGTADYSNRGFKA